MALVGPSAGAHALRTSSDPAAGATLAASPAQVLITFTEQPDPRQSLIQVLDTSGNVRAGGHPVPVPGQVNEVRIPVPTPLPKGIYTVSWKTISAVDGHLATGAFAFGVQVTPSGATSTSSAGKAPPSSEVATVSRFIYLCGLIGLLGLTFTELVVLAGEPPVARLRRALAVAWLLAAAGAVGIAQAARAGAGVHLGELFSSSIGHALVVRLAPLALAGISLILLAAPASRTGAGGRRRLLLGIAGLAGLVAMLADVAKSHAAASHSWLWFRVGTQLVHIAAAGVWIGGLAGLLLALGPLGPGRRGPAARRFSFFAGVAIGAVGVTGTLRAVDEVGSWRGLFHTGFGQLIIVKSALFVLLAALGAVNRFRHVAKAGADPSGLRRTGRAELVVMAAVLVATAFLQNLSPARDAVQASPATATLPPVVVDTHDFADTYRLRLTVSPGTPGFNQFSLAVTDYFTGKPARAGSASLGFHAPNNPEVGDSSLDLKRRASGSYTGQGANLSLLGQWSVTILVQNGASTASVPVDLVTESPHQPVRVQPFAGSPTVYTVTASGGNQLQIYIDPINQGRAEFHATFLDAAGQELPMKPTLSATAARSPGWVIGPLLTYRDLDNVGHFVADGPGTPGTYSFTVAGITQSGAALGATITLPVR